MELIFRICLFLIGIVNLLPSILAFLPHKISGAYGVAVPDSNYELLFRHRAVLFGIIGGIMLFSAITKRHYAIAVMVGLLSMVSFILLYFLMDGNVNTALTKVMKVDVVAVIILLIGYALFKFNQAMNKFQKVFIKNTVQIFLKLQAFLFRNTSFNFLGYALNKFLANTTIKAKKIGKAQTLDELGQNWQRGFPAKKQVPIVGKDDKTIFGEIHTPCPLRGTGNVQACYKMMSYDRQIVEKGGGQFVVLQSQAETGIHHCKIAIRFKGEDMSDLRQAHEVKKVNF